ncbi:MAG: oligoendopeptidase F, partial [Pseudomonadota bacterium]
MPIPSSRIVRDSATDTGAAELGPLPEWDLSDLYSGMGSPELAQDLERAEAGCRGFATSFDGKLTTLEGDGLAAAISRMEEINQILGRIMSFAGLLYYQNTTDPERAKFMGDMQGRITQITQPMVFFTLELNRLEDSALDAMMSASADLARYRPWLKRVRAMRPHQLSDEL